MEIAPLLWSWLATIIGSLALTTCSVIGFMKELSKQGYKLNLDKINSTPTSENTINFQKALFFIPIINLGIPFLIQNTISKNSEKFMREGYIIPLNKKEQEMMEYEPTLSNLLHINANHDKQKVGMLSYQDTNHQINTIQFTDENGIIAIEEVSGPHIEAKNRLEQRAFLLQLLEQDELEKKYESLQKIIEKAIIEESEEINLIDIEPYEISVVAALIINYGNYIKINIRLIDNISPEEEKETLIILGKALQEISGFEIEFLEEEPKQKTLNK